MSTHCAIIEQTENGQYRGIYCHFDGNPGYALRVLDQFYTKPLKVSRLIDLGDLSILAKNIDPHPDRPHTFGNVQKDTCVAYHRDRGEELNISHGQSWQRVADQIDAHYVYVFADGQWKEKTHNC